MKTVRLASASCVAAAAGATIIRSAGALGLFALAATSSLRDSNCPGGRMKLPGGGVDEGALKGCCLWGLGEVALKTGCPGKLPWGDALALDDVFDAVARVCGRPAPG